MWTHFNREESRLDRSSPESDTKPWHSSIEIPKQIYSLMFNKVITHYSLNYPI